ncbi:MAG: hypothetical protein FWF59_06870 [Turicibacter sp.]|nr:hypothetical protein [Turicibacter sp.]
MNQNKFKIEYPSKEEIGGQVRSIVGAMPKVKRFIPFLRDMHEQLGWRYIFRDYVEIGFIALLFAAYLGLFFSYLHDAGRSMDNISHLYAYLFITSPLLFGSLTIISLVDKQSTFEVENACKYNVYQVMAYRMLAFSVVAIIANFAQMAVVSRLVPGVDFVMAVMISLSSLLIFALGFLYLTRASEGKRPYWAILAWVLLNVGMAFYNEAIYDLFLNKIPFLAYGIALALAVGIYVKEIRQLAIPMMKKN